MFFEPLFNFLDPPLGNSCFSFPCRSKHQLLLVLVSPPLLALLTCLGYTAVFTPADNVLQLLGSSCQLLMDGLAFSYTSSMLYSSWLFPVVCLCVWPQWLAFWWLSCSYMPLNVEEDTDTGHLHSD